MNVPEHLIYPLDVFAEEFSRSYSTGVEVWKDADVAFVGLARNCCGPLSDNLSRLVNLCGGVKSWQLHVETNDNTDSTEQVLDDFCRQFGQATYTNQTLGREQFTAEFAGRRTEALAEYRTACQAWVRDHARHSDFVVAIDFDSWGGWSHAGFLHGVGELYQSATAYGMASVSLMEYQRQGQWLQYDCWALRLNSSFDDYTAGIGGWKHSWLPPVGSPVVPVASAFGGMAIYKTGGYLSGTYDGSDCEHVPFHASIAAKTGKSLYLDPAMRTVMSWLE
jgi:hypothetical protein